MAEREGFSGPLRRTPKTEENSTFSGQPRQVVCTANMYPPMARRKQIRENGKRFPLRFCKCVGLRARSARPEAGNRAFEARASFGSRARLPRIGHTPPKGERMPPRIAIIGSFRPARYGGVLDVVRAFREAGLEVVSPSGSEIVAGEEFVRFATDDVASSDAMVQSLTLEKIFGADAVYVVAPEGYVGNTTCYEIGRVVQRRQPIYFSEKPVDLPVHIPDWCVVSPDRFVIQFAGSTPFEWLYSLESGGVFDVERRLAPP